MNPGAGRELNLEAKKNGTRRIETTLFLGRLDPNQLLFYTT
jgi:hypothetical protein|tara:strand:- start:6677 stop:6799 length:123 start_codon:yes stop_codon:yes gene_type:complete